MTPFEKLRFAIVCSPGPVHFLMSIKPIGSAGILILGGSTMLLGLSALLLGKPTKALLLTGAVSLALAFSIQRNNWPLHLAFRLSEPAFQRAAERIRAGETSDRAQWIGLFRVGRTEMHRERVPTLWTGLCPAGKTGFAACGPVAPPFNPWEHQVMNERWQLILED